MAPEVMLQNNYDTGIDIWSLGITVIELALGAPPHSHMNSMLALTVRNVIDSSLWITHSSVAFWLTRVLFVCFSCPPSQNIIRDPPPKLSGHSVSNVPFSKDINDFLALCLVKDPKQRAPLATLLTTKFIRGAKRTSDLSSLIASLNI
jgi:serine/threonine-protein kinase 24/25/MST4